MCMFGGGKAPKPEAPIKYANQKEPDGGMVQADVRRSVTDRLRSYAPTILTSPMGSTQNAPTGVNLLGQTQSVSA